MNNVLVDIKQGFGRGWKILLFYSKMRIREDLKENLVPSHLKLPWTKLLYLAFLYNAYVKLEEILQ